MSDTEHKHNGKFSGQRVIIVTYYYAPLNWIQSYRPVSWANYLADQGAEVMVITRQWQQSDNDMLSDHPLNNQPPQVHHPRTGITVWTYPFRRNNKLFKYTRPLLKVPKMPGLLNQLFLKLGYHSFERNFALGNMEHILAHAKAFSPHLVATSAPTYDIIQTSNRLAKATGAKLTIDFRDTWNNLMLLNKAPIVDKRSAFRMQWMRKSIQGAVVKASLVSAISEGMRRVLQQQLEPNRSIVVTNGYEAELFEDLRKQMPPPQLPLVLSYTGTLYDNQLSDIWLDAFDEFARSKPKGTVRYQFIGSKWKESVEKVLRERIPAYALEVTGRIPRQQSLAKAASSHVLFYPGWKGYTGILSGKIFEYLGLHRPILLAPTDEDDLEALVKETRAGWTLNDKQAVIDVLESEYATLEQGRLPGFMGDHDIIASYSREAQADKLFSAAFETLTTDKD